MQGRISTYIRRHHIGLLALFIALSGTAYAVDGPLPGQNQVGSEDIINGEVRNPDLGADSVGSGKIDDRQVKNADLSVGASSSNTIADGGIQGIDVKSDTLTGAQIDESSLGTVPNADQLDGIDSSEFLRGVQVSRMDFRANAGDSGAVLSLGGLTFLANCHPSRDLQWFYGSAVNDASLHMSWSVAGDAVAKTLVNDNVDSGVVIDPFPSGGNDDDIAGSGVYTKPDGGSVAFDFQMEDSDGTGLPEALGGTKDCLFTGVATYVPGS
jgi:hypothetical protein